MGGGGGEDNNVLCSTFLVSALFQVMLLHDVCTGRGGGGRGRIVTFFVQHIQKVPRLSHETGFNMGLRMYYQKSSWDMT